MTQLFNIQGLMAASAQAQKAAQIIRNGGEGGQLLAAAETARKAEEAKGLVKPPEPSEATRKISEDDRRERGDKHSRGSKNDSDDEDDLDDEPKAHIDVLV